MDLKTTYNKIAADWSKDHEADTWWVEGTNKFLSYLQLGDSILDVGCGTGLKTKYIIEKGFQVTGIDFSEKMIELAKQRVVGANFTEMDITKPILLSQSFDGIFAQAVLLHIPKKEIHLVIKNLTQILKPSGYFYLAVKATRQDRQGEQIVKESDYGYEYERFFSYFTNQELQQYLTANGLEIVYTNATDGLQQNWIHIIAQK